MCDRYGPHKLYSDWNLKNVNFDRKKSPDMNAKRYLASIDRKLRKNPDAYKLLEFIPIEPLIRFTADKVYKYRSIYLTVDGYSKAKYDLINLKLINYYKMSYVKHDGSIYYYNTPHFLTPMGIYYYKYRFGKSPDSFFINTYQNATPENRVYTVHHIRLLKEFYEEKGYHVESGQYPFDLIVDRKHCFLLTEIHEQAIGIEMRLSKAVDECVKHGLTLYCPAKSTAEMKRVNAIIAGILFHSNDITDFSYVVYHEAQICNDVSVSNWSYYRTRSNVTGEAKLPDVLPFPKLNVSSHELVDTQMLGIEKKEKDEITHYFKPVFINNLWDYEIAPDIYITAGIDKIGVWWRLHAAKAKVICTGKCRETMTKAILEYPELLIVDDSDDELHQETLNIFKQNGTRVIRSHRNHAKAVLEKDKLFIHSMTTTNYMGNKRESYATLYFGNHPERDKIYAGFYWMLYYLGTDQQKKFVKEWERIKHHFNYNLLMMGHFHGKNVTSWPYYNLLKSAAKLNPVKIYTSHLGIKKLSKLAGKSGEIRIQGVSRLANHDTLMLADCPVYRERQWHPRVIFNEDFIALGSWDLSPIRNQKELQILIYLNEEVNPEKQN
jgi:hypothetical protein